MGSVEWSERELRVFDELVARTKEVRRVLKRLKKPLKDMLAEDAANERGPDGKWPKRTRVIKRSTLVEKGRTRKATKTRGERTAVSFIGRDKILGSAPQKIKYTARGNELKAESTIRNKKGVKFGRVLADGGPVGRGAVLPARPFLYIPERFIPVADEKLADFVFGIWDERGVVVA